MDIPLWNSGGSSTRSEKSTTESYLKPVQFNSCTHNPSLQDAFSYHLIYAYAMFAAATVDYSSTVAEAHIDIDPMDTALGRAINVYKRSTSHLKYILW